MLLQQAVNPEHDVQIRSGLVAQLEARADRARCLLCPIYAQSHFTALVLTRWGCVEGQGEEKLPAEQGKWGGSKAKDPAQEALVFDQLRRPKLTWAQPWQISYFDSLQAEKSQCREIASAVLAALEVTEALPARSNSRFQKHNDCGCWTLYYFEEYCRRARGEPEWGLDYNLGQIIGRLLKFKKKLQEHQKTVHEEGTSAAASA